MCAAQVEEHIEQRMEKELSQLFQPRVVALSALQAKVFRRFTAYYWLGSIVWHSKYSLLRYTTVHDIWCVKGIPQLLSGINASHSAWTHRISTSLANQWLQVFQTLPVRTAASVFASSGGAG